MFTALAGGFSSLAKSVAPYALLGGIPELIALQITQVMCINVVVI